MIKGDTVRPNPPHDRDLLFRDIGIGFLVNLVVFFSGNAIYKWYTNRALEAVSFTEASGFQDPVAREEALIQELGLDQRFRDFEFFKQYVVNQVDEPCITLLSKLFREIRSTPAGNAGVSDSKEFDRDVSDVLRQHLAGNREASLVNWIGIRRYKLVDYQELTKQIETVDANWRKAVEIKSQEEELFRAIIQFTGRRMDSSLRWGMKPNGLLQWLAFLSFFTLCSLATFRFFMISRVLGTSRKVNTNVYRTFSWLVGLLPALGFIGTVYGMGNALAAASSLFTSADKVSAVTEITEHLGFAFDTTLVGLCLSVIAGLAILLLRRHEESQLLSKGLETVPRLIHE